jgi:tetratricopeptide (TPR) repeat protein
MRKLLTIRWRKSLIAFLVFAGVLFISSNIYADSGAMIRKKDSRFTAYWDGTVLDAKTGLMWAAKDNGAGMDKQSAEIFIRHFRAGGYMDWRLPTLDELAGLYEPEKLTRYCYPITEFIMLSACCPWASDMNGARAASFDYNYNTHSWDPPSYSDRTRALPVRGIAHETAKLSARQKYGKGGLLTTYNPDAVAWAEKSARSAEAGNWDEVIRTTSIAIAIDPSYPESYVGRSWAYLEKGFPDEALADSQKALELDGNNVGALNNRGLFFLRKGETQKARMDFEAACNGGLAVSCENLKLVSGDQPTER